MTEASCPQHGNYPETALWEVKQGWVPGRVGQPEVKDQLKKLVMRSKNPSILFADHVDEYGSDFFRMTCEKNLEGIG